MITYYKKDKNFLTANSVKIVVFYIRITLDNGHVYSVIFPI